MKMTIKFGFKGFSLLQAAVAFLIFVLFPQIGFSFSGSVQLRADQRFYEDSRFGFVNGFSEWWAPQFGFDIGLIDLGWNIEPIVGFEFAKNETTACAVESDGITCLRQNGVVVASEDKFEYQIYGFSSGLRWKAWETEFFPISPFIDTKMQFHYTRIRKLTSNVTEKKLVTGIDWGMELGGGCFFSFFTNQVRRNQMKSEWDLKDFGATASAYFLPGGWFKRGLGAVSGTGGWSFGLGLLGDW
ncbi:MAG: hypothetical protein COV44_11025 [Deltaproteobacteria bacterium CG11_big_fil_rev_8_21_14_0_20_45_16]|nr:MAG: hypothetical protein COV44_11025 [Deltaproteobacteria bacterium CG11_big_fil_rev_8_21_14_0_20_45_16]